MTSRPRTLAQRRGDAGEESALALLLGAGLRLLDRNLRCRGGEIDLVMTDADTVVFVEVRSRSRDEFGGALASIDRRKMRKLALAAQWFLLRHPRYAKSACRFDVVALGAADTEPCWLRGAFTMNDL